MGLMRYQEGGQELPAGTLGSGQSGERLKCSTQTPGQESGPGSMLGLLFTCCVILSRSYYSLAKGAL